MDLFDVCRRSANDWLRNKQDEGLIEAIREKPFPKLYELTTKGERFTNDLEGLMSIWKDIKEEKYVDEPKKALESLKSR